MAYVRFLARRQPFPEQPFDDEEILLQGVWPDTNVSWRVSAGALSSPPALVVERPHPGRVQARLEGGRNPRGGSSGRFLVLEVDDAGLSVTTDLAASVPAFRYERPEGFEIVTDLRFAEGGLVLARTQLAILMACEHLIGDRTVWEGWLRCPPASVYRANRELVVSTTPWWRLPERPSGGRRLRATINRATDSMVESFRSLEIPFVASLTGGVDSRTVLAAAIGGNKRPVCTFTHGRGSTQELHVAAAISRRLGLEQRQLVLDARYPRQLWQDLGVLLACSNGMTNSWWMHGVPSAEIVRAAAPLITYGGGGEVARSYFYGWTGIEPDLVDQLERKFARAAVQGVVERALGLALGQLRDAWRDACREALREVDGASAESRLDYFYLTQRMSHMSASSLVVFDRSGVDTLFSFLTPPILDAAFLLTPEERQKALLHREIQRKFAPRWLRHMLTDRGREQFPQSSVSMLLWRVLAGVRRRVSRSGNPATGVDLVPPLVLAAGHDLGRGLERHGLPPDGAEALADLAARGVPGALTAFGNYVGTIAWMPRPAP